MHKKCVMKWHIVMAEMMRIAIITYLKVTMSNSDLPSLVSQWTSLAILSMDDPGWPLNKVSDQEMT